MSKGNYIHMIQYIKYIKLSFVVLAFVVLNFKNIRNDKRLRNRLYCL